MLKFRPRQGYTIIELVTVLTIISILVIVGAQVGRLYLKKLDTAQAEKEIESLIVQIEQHHLSNLTYKGFPISQKHVPEANHRYTINIVELPSELPLTTSSVIGLNWAIKATSLNPDNPAYLVNSYGTKCKNDSASTVTFITCGSGEKTW